MVEYQQKTYKAWAPAPCTGCCKHMHMHTTASPHSPAICVVVYAPAESVCYACVRIQLGVLSEHHLNDWQAFVSCVVDTAGPVADAGIATAAATAVGFPRHPDSSPPSSCC